MPLRLSACSGIADCTADPCVKACWDGMHKQDKCAACSWGSIRLSDVKLLIVKCPGNSSECIHLLRPFSKLQCQTRTLVVTLQAYSCTCIIEHSSAWMHMQSKKFWRLAPQDMWLLKFCRTGCSILLTAAIDLNPGGSFGMSTSLNFFCHQNLMCGSLCLLAHLCLHTSIVGYCSPPAYTIFSDLSSPVIVIEH